MKNTTNNTINKTLTKITNKAVKEDMKKTTKPADKTRIKDLLSHLEKLESGMEVNHRSGKKGYQIRKALRKLGYYVSKN